MEEVKTEDKKYCVYMHINRHNDKKYIGLTGQNPNERWGDNGCEYLRTYPNGKYIQPIFARALKKYNDWNNDWDHIIVADKLTKNDACKIEIELIDLYKTNVCRWKNKAMGYNMTDGGEGLAGYSFTEERKKQYSIMFSGENNPMYNRPWWDENTPQEKIDEWKINVAKYGKDNGFFGKHHTAESKKKISETRNKTPVIQLGMNGEFIAEYESATKATRVTGVHSANILSCCYGNCKSAGGFMWICKEDYDVEQVYTYQDNSKRPVIQLSLSGDFINEYISVCEASRQTGINNSCIYRACIQDNWTAGGFIWIFKEDYNPLKLYTHINRNIVSVVCLDVNNNYICEYKSITEAHNATGADPSAIIRCCRGKQKTAQGFKWKYKMEWEEMLHAIQIVSK